MSDKPKHSISKLREMVKNNYNSEINSKIMLIKFKIFLTQEDKLKIQKLQQQLIN